MINCQRCGAQNADHSKFCLSCGNDLRAMGGPPPPAP
ncbi:MAG: zinc-ribbon domain-containing protein, partial [Deltaproteobacteria bacterium]|nr:zinc-ribbon domain-containing protein [Deltaproteobacteria bacterium]